MSEHEPVDEDDEVIDEDVGLTRSGLMGMVGKNIVCDECGESSFRIKQGVDSNRCRHCENIIEDAWSVSTGTVAEKLIAAPH